MQEFVSQHRASVVALLASMSIVCVLLAPTGLPWTGLAWVTLALFVLTQLIHEVAVEPARVVAVRTPIGVKGTRSVV